MNGGLADRTDGELVALVLGGRQAAFAEIVSRHKLPLHRLIARIIGDDDEALDVLQEVFVAAHGSLHRFDMARPMRAWLARIAINKARDWRRRRAVRRLISAVLPIERVSDIADDRPAIDTLAADREELQQVGAAIATLPANLRESLVLRAIEGMSQAETAEALGISEKAVETRLYRSRQRLASEIDRQR